MVPHESSTFLGTLEATETFINQLSRTENNNEFIASVMKTSFD